MTDRDRWGLRGPVRSCRLQRTWYSRRGDGDLCTNEERSDTTIVEFRPDGSLARRWHRNPDGSEWESTHEYDSIGRLVTVRAGNTAGLIDLHHYNYGSAGRLERVLVRGPDDRERIAESCEYDAAGRKRKTLYVDLTVKGSGGTHYSSGVEGTDCAYSAPGAVTVTTLHNTRDQPAELLFHDSAGRVLSRVEFVYDEAGNLLEEMLTKHPAQSAALVALLGADPVRRLYRYDAQGRRIETHHSVCRVAWPVLDDYGLQREWRSE